jgi:tetratricopeptide (TPR) repeat protein
MAIQLDLTTELNRLLMEGQQPGGAVLAKKIGVSASSLRAYLDGAAVPSVATLDRLLDVLDATAAQRQRFATLRANLEVGRKVGRGVQVPRELPPDVYGFAGRTAQLAKLDRVFGNGTTAVVTGTGGVGKTALALHWAHRAIEDFPDGQLYIDLHGYDPDKPVESMEALATLLRSLGVPGAEVPLGLTERIARYRTLLDGRRMLVVLDNAFSADQVRPLLPVTASCKVLITSRDSVAGIVGQEGASRLSLDRLPLDEAVELLGMLLGESTDAGPVAELAQRCERLPLALRIVADLAASRPLTELVAGLDQHRLDVLDGAGDERTAIRGVFSWSFRQLPPATARAFRLIGLHRGRDFDRYVLAALTGSDLETASRLIDRLREAHLVETDGTGRFRAHDLLREYATELAAEEPDDQREAALTRLLDYYAGAASAAMRVIYPNEVNRFPKVAPPTTPVPAFDSQRWAFTWLDSELANLVVAANTSMSAHTVSLATTLNRHLRTLGWQHEANALHTNAAHAARRLGDHTGEMRALTGLARSHFMQGRYGAAAHCYEQAIGIARDLGARIGEMDALHGLGRVHELQGRYGLALGCYERVLGLARDAADRVGELDALIGLGHIHRRQGRHPLAAECYAEVASIARRIGESRVEIAALRGLAHAHIVMGDRAAAISNGRQALRLARETGDRGELMAALSGLGGAYHQQGVHSMATRCFEEVRDLAVAIGNRNFEFEVALGLGHIARATGSLTEALTHHRTALTLAESLGQPEDQARACYGLELVLSALGKGAEARRYFEQTLRIMTRLGLPATDEFTVAGLTLSQSTQGTA